jgi:hypothetical protein
MLTTIVDHNDIRLKPIKRGATGSNPVAPTRSGYMLILMGNIGGKDPQGRGSIIFDHARC